MTILYGTSTFFGLKRLRVRRVDEIKMAHRALEATVQSGLPSIIARHGGTVANSYGYPAETEAVVAVAIDPETVVLYGGRIAANKATLCGAATVAGCADLFDERITNAIRLASARQSIVTRARLVAGLLPEAAIARLEATL